ncbi:hypothetical protein [Sedimentitalea sp.]|uniref:hypothetical protein n=1 Tax=Sedimentitalea sp. TaxID=2048915 RepID=UPI003296953E
METQLPSSKKSTGHLVQLAETPAAVLFMVVMGSVRLIEADDAGIVALWLDIVDDLKAGGADRKAHG